MRLQVTLPADYLARNVSLVIRRHYPKRRWEIRAADGNGTHFAVQVDGSPAPDFARKRDAQAYLDALAMPAGFKIWAEPRQRSRAALQPYEMGL